ncbi:hypothetical protein GCM10027168_54350 [Streptomyces capparidis]
MPELTTVPAKRRRHWDLALRFSPAQPYFRARASHRLAVLAYHEIDDRRRFAAQLDRLRRSAHPVSLAEVADSLAHGTPLPPHSVLLTFDDGDPSLLERGLPLLVERGIPAVVFVVAELIGTHRPFWWREAAHLVQHGGRARGLNASTATAAVRALRRMPDPDRRRILAELRVTAHSPAPPHRQLTVRELRMLKDAGIEVGNHTLGHACLDQCDEATVRTEIAEAHRMLTSWLGEPPRAFAYPDGDAVPAAQGLLEQLGYSAAFLFDHRLAEARPQHQLRLSRLRMHSTASRERFETILSGLHPAVQRLRGGV